MNARASVPEPGRIDSLDVLRGVALLGILLMNIQSFAMPGAAYINPTAYGDLGGVNRWVWAASHLVADQKFISLFSMLFGAGICLFTERALQRGRSAIALHYRRSLWLLLFGLAHAYLIWYGDILVAYALCAMWVVGLRNRGPATLLLAGLAVFSVSSVFYLWLGANLGHFPPEALAQVRKAWRPDAATVASELAAYRGGWRTQMPARASEAAFLQTLVFLTVFVWRAGGMMLIGMALYKWGVLSARRSDRFYWWLLATCLPAGLALTGVGLVQNFRHEFALEYSMYLGSQYNYWGSAFQAVGYVAATMLFVRSGVLPALQRRLGAVGRTAFSNYIAQSLICTLIFYGHGLGLFGHAPRWQQLMIVFGVWALQLWLAPWWLERYRFGPLEWLWRSLTYWRRPPMRRPR